MGMRMIRTAPNHRTCVLFRRARAVRFVPAAVSVNSVIIDGVCLRVLGAVIWDTSDGSVETKGRLTLVPGLDT